MDDELTGHALRRALGSLFAGEPPAGFTAAGLRAAGRRARRRRTVLGTCAVSLAALLAAAAVAVPVAVGSHRGNGPVPAASPRPAQVPSWQDTRCGLASPTSPDARAHQRYVAAVLTRLSHQLPGNVTNRIPTRSSGGSAPDACDGRDWDGVELLVADGARLGMVAVSTTRILGTYQRRLPAADCAAPGAPCRVQTPDGPADVRVETAPTLLRVTAIWPDDTVVTVSAQARAGARPALTAPPLTPKEATALALTPQLRTRG